MNAIELTSKGCISKSSTKHSLHNNLIIASNKHLLKSAIVADIVIITLHLEVQTEFSQALRVPDIPV